MGGEGPEEALHEVEELDKHFADGEGGKKVVFVAVNSGGLFVPKMVAVEEDVVDGVEVAAVWTCDVVVGSSSEPGVTKGWFLSSSLSIHSFPFPRH